MVSHWSRRACPKIVNGTKSKASSALTGRSAKSPTILKRQPNKNPSFWDDGRATRNLLRFERSRISRRSGARLHGRSPIAVKRARLLVALAAQSKQTRESRRPVFGIRQGRAQACPRGTASIHLEIHAPTARHRAPD